MVQYVYLFIMVAQENQQNWIMMLFNAWKNKIVDGLNEYDVRWY